MFEEQVFALFFLIANAGSAFLGYRLFRRRLGSATGPPQRIWTATYGLVLLVLVLLYWRVLGPWLGSRLPIFSADPIWAVVGPAALILVPAALWLTPLVLIFSVKRARKRYLRRKAKVS